MRSFGSDALNRRGFLSSLAILAGSVIGRQKLFAATGASASGGPWKGKITGLGESGNVYTELGLNTVINAQGTETVLGGSLIRPEVKAVMELASEHFVVIMDLEAAVGKRIAEMLKLPQGYSAIVTSGAGVRDPKRIFRDSYRKQRNVYPTDSGFNRDEIRGDHSAGTSQRMGSSDSNDRSKDCRS